MRKRSMPQKPACWGAVVLALAGCTKSSVPVADEGGQPPPPSSDGGTQPQPSFTERLISDLQAKGFLVSQGYTILYQASDCERFTYAVTKNCYGNNPAAPYVAAVVKPWPDEYLDPAVASVMGGVVPGHSGTFRLDAREALVIFGRLPPPGKYFSVQTWVYSQEGHWRPSDYAHWAEQPNLAVPMQYLFDTLPADDPASTRLQSFSALSNIINNVVIERQSGGSFGQTRYFVITPDGSMDEAVRGALQGQGVLGKDVFTEPIPQSDSFGSLGPLGLGKEANDFVTFLRYAVPDDQAAGDAWRNELPLTVLRVRAPANAGAPRPYPLLTFEPREAVDEVGDAQLGSDFESLLRSVCDRASAAPWSLDGLGCEDRAADVSYMKDLVRDYGWTGPYCRSVGMDCLGDQQDASYFFAPPSPLDDGEIYAVVSPLATKTGNATYSAVSLNNAALLKGAANLLHTVLEGSASGYAATVTDPDKFFVWFFARDCGPIAGLTDGKCTTITPEMVPLRGDPTALGDPALFGMFQPGLRNYIKPGTARGPDSTKQITPRFLKFTRRP